MEVKGGRGGDSAEGDARDAGVMGRMRCYTRRVVEGLGARALRSDGMDVPDDPTEHGEGLELRISLHSCTTHPSSNTALVITSEKNMPSPVGTRFTGTKLLPKKTHATKHAKYPTASS